MTQGTGKIDRVYEEMVKMEERFTKLEKDQQRHFEEHIEKAAASIIAGINKKIEECECNKEIINYLKSVRKEKRKVEEQVLNPLPKQKHNKGWHPENLRIEDTPFYKL